MSTKKWKGLVERSFSKEREEELRKEAQRELTEEDRQRGLGTLAAYGEPIEVPVPEWLKKSSSGRPVTLEEDRERFKEVVELKRLAVEAKKTLNTTCLDLLKNSLNPRMCDEQRYQLGLMVIEAEHNERAADVVTDIVLDVAREFLEREGSDSRH